MSEFVPCCLEMTLVNKIETDLYFFGNFPFYRKLMRTKIFLGRLIQEKYCLEWGSRFDLINLKYVSGKILFRKGASF